MPPSRQARKPGIFPTFFISGFECSTFVWKDVGRRDLTAETRHREHAIGDYQMLRELGIAVAREGVPWPMVESTPGRYDFSSVDPLLEAMNQEPPILPIWDLCHYGYPDDADPYADDFPDRFAAYARAAAEYLIPRVEHRGANFFTPINEITYFAQAAGEWGLFAPHRKRREERNELRLRLCRAAIKGVKAIREVDPEARFVNLDPLVTWWRRAIGPTSLRRPATRPTRTPSSPRTSSRAAGSPSWAGRRRSSISSA